MNQGVYFGQIVIGPAGSGKVTTSQSQSTFCKHMQEMAQTLKRNIIVVNLDPAAQHNQYKCDIDIQQLITLDDVMQQMQLGPNGGLLFCIEYLIQNQQWLLKQLDQVIRQDDYVIFDCPGQIQLYSDQTVFREIAKFLQQYGNKGNILGFSLISMYMIDVNFIGDDNKYASGILQALSSQIALQLPSITVLTKCDLIENTDKLEKWLNYFSNNEDQIGMEQQNDPSLQLPRAIKRILHQNSQVSIRSLNLEDEDNVRDLLWEADYAIQYGENIEPDDKTYDQAQQFLNNGH